MSDEVEVPVVFPDWSKAVRLASVNVTVVEAIGPLTEAYAMNHRDGPVWAMPGQYLVCLADDPDVVAAVDSLDGYEVLPPDESSPAVEGEPGVARIIGEPIILEDADAEAFIAALAAAGPNQDDPFAGHVGGPAADVAEIDVKEGL